ncbi:MAG: AAA family ATPase [Rhodothermaceae bacterium]|nr:AAA family ATPase [Bacteroidota bacterium]MXW32835.1 AAA family ATPase [Rhodothermaceae bacterium]MXZ17812.1 AAA family ATPase [Rhodothermaceae bacterium]MYE63516.1 AAA family ATPase [Rhodothermaceae bacterium]MYG68656.1 AAA family ATPase [Rhodothermaceae bacterium]
MSCPITDISITDVRTFSGTHQAKLSRITLLVGENSVAKSTFLGCLNALGQKAALHELDDSTNFFNQKPFLMGSFESIVRSGCQSFSVALGLDRGLFHRFAINFAKGSDAPFEETKLEVQMYDRDSKLGPSLTINREISEDGPEYWRFDGPKFQFYLNRSEVSYSQFTTWLSRYIAHGNLPFSGDPMKFKLRVNDPVVYELTAFTKFVNFFRNYFRGPISPPRIIPISPHGLGRKRKYSNNPIKALSGDNDLEMISSIGRELGLFEQLDVRELSADQFEILVNVSGSFYNLVDVGYGVASILPFIITLGSAPPDAVFLLQQPEVHVHPSAQAKLIKMMAESDHAFVVETHSDHVIKWLRILIKEGLLESSDVGIIYFERLLEDKSATRLHQISPDRRANLSGHPANFREFFSEEANRLLGFAT